LNSAERSSEPTPSARPSDSIPKKVTKIIQRPWPRLLSIEVAADYAGVSPGVIKEWYAEGKINSHPLPGIRGRKHLEKLVFERSEFDRFLGVE
jgi:hypothetical protein